MLTIREALKIARKLEAEVKEGRKHTRATVLIKGHRIGTYGISRGRKSRHSHIPKRLRLNQSQARSLARCDLSKEDYVAILQAKGQFPPDPRPVS